MIIQQFVAEGLGNASHMVTAPRAGVCAVIDPLRDVDVYLAAAQEMGVRITHVLETHLHADFVSGARELAARTGATIGASAGAGLRYDSLPLKEGQVVSVGEVELKVLATPGHTPEHVSFLARDASQVRLRRTPQALFSGGALLVGSAARTDLLGEELAEPLARQLYHTLRAKLMALADEVAVYPTHGAGSFCASGTGGERVTTIGQERRTNYLLQMEPEEAFVAEMRRREATYPAYYRHMRAINQQGPPLLGELPTLAPLSPKRVSGLLAADAVAAVDTRPPEAFAAGHIPAAYGIPFGPACGVWVGAVVPFAKPLVLVAESAESQLELVRQLVRIGYDELRGYLEGSMAAWREAGLPVSTTPTLNIDEVRHRQDELLILDVRQEDEWAAGHIPGALHIPLGKLPGRLGELPRTRPLAVHCAHGYRAAIAASLLQREGFGQVYRALPGFDAWLEAGYEVAR